MKQARVSGDPHRQQTKHEQILMAYMKSPVDQGSGDASGHHTATAVADESWPTLCVSSPSEARPQSYLEGQDSGQDARLVVLHGYLLLVLGHIRVLFHLSHDCSFAFSAVNCLRKLERCG